MHYTLANFVKISQFVTMTYELDCVVLDNIQQSIRELIDIKTIVLHMSKPLVVISVPLHCFFSPLGKPADRAIYFACVNFFLFLN